MVSGLPFCRTAALPCHGPVSWRRCFPCDDLTLPPRSAAALWDVVSGWSLEPVPPLSFLLNLFLPSQCSVFIRFYHPKVRGRHFCEKKCRAAGQAAHCSVSAAYENSVYSIRTNQPSYMKPRSHPQKGVLNRRFKRRFAYFAAVGKVGRAAARNSPENKT